MPYRRRPQRRTTTGRVHKPNARPGNCRDCKLAIPAGAGELYREESGAWSVVHIAAEWAGSPVSGQWTYGCPDSTDQLNRDGKFGRDGVFLSEYDRLGTVQAPVQAEPGADLAEVSRRAGSKYAYTSGGARMTVSSQRCEDAPCCGCCD